VDSGVLHLVCFALTHPPAQYGLALINIQLGETDFSCLGSPSTSECLVEERTQMEWLRYHFKATPTC
jgi:hypothetical protein